MGIRHTKLAAAVLAFVITIASAAPVFADMSISDFDEQMYDKVKTTIDAIGEDKVKEDEMEILDKLKDVLSSGEDMGKNEGRKALNDVCEELNIKADIWRSGYLSLVEEWGVVDSASDAEEDAKDVESQTEILKILQWDSNGGAMKALMMKILANQQLSALAKLFQMFGISLCIVFGLSEIIQKATERSVAYDALWRAFAQMCIGLFVIYNSIYIVGAIMCVGSSLIGSAFSAAPSATSTTLNCTYQVHTALFTSLNKMEETGGVLAANSKAAAGMGFTYDWGALAQTAFSFLDGALGSAGIAGGIAGFSVGGPFGALLGAFGGKIGSLLMNWAYGKFINFFISLTVYAILIDLGIRLVTAPIAVADLFSERFRSTGVRWLKGVAVAAMQGTIIYITVVVGSLVTEVVESGGIPGLPTLGGIVVQFTMIGLFARSKSIASEIIGAH